MVRDTGEKSAGGVEGDSGDTELVGKVVGPAEEEIRYDGNRW